MTACGHSSLCYIRQLKLAKLVLFFPPTQPTTQCHSGGNYSLVKHLSYLWLIFILLFSPFLYSLQSPACSLVNTQLFLLSLTCLHRIKCLMHCISQKKYWSLRTEISFPHVFYPSPMFYLFHDNAVSRGVLQCSLKCIHVGFISDLSKLGTCSWESKGLTVSAVHRDHCD